MSYRLSNSEKKTERTDGDVPQHLTAGVVGVDSHQLAPSIHSSIPLSKLLHSQLHLADLTEPRALPEKEKEKT